MKRLLDVITDQEEAREVRVTREGRLGVCVCGKHRQAHSSLTKLTLDLRGDYHMMVPLLLAFFMAFCRLQWSHGMHMGFSFKKTFSPTRLCSHTRPDSLHGLIWMSSLLSLKCVSWDLGCDGKVSLLTGSMPCWRWRKMRIASLIWILHVVNLTEGLDNTKILRYRRKYSSMTCPHTYT